MTDTLTGMAAELGDALIGPHAVVPWWGVVAWLVMIVVGMILPVFLPDPNRQREDLLKQAKS